jgi:hypothetical protein
MGEEVEVEEDGEEAGGSEARGSEKGGSAAAVATAAGVSSGSGASGRYPLPLAAAAGQGLSDTTHYGIQRILNPSLYWVPHVVFGGTFTCSTLEFGDLAKSHVSIMARYQTCRALHGTTIQTGH